MSNLDKPCKCPLPAGFSGSQGGFFAGNINRSNLATRKMSRSNIIQTQTKFGLKGGSRLRFANKELNEFGRWDGAPSGSGQSIRNQFN